MAGWPAGGKLAKDELLLTLGHCRSGWRPGSSPSAGGATDQFSPICKRSDPAL